MQFVDQVRISVESGAGGNGMVAWRREKFVAYGGPAGGDGGRGGDVFLEATTDLHTLLDFKYLNIFKAEDGGKGQSKNCHGKDGEDLIIRVPCGTLVIDATHGEAVADLTDPGDRVLIAAGGRGGRGNSRFASARRQAPQFSEPGEAAVLRDLTLELKLMADIGLLGMPNAGKSTLISVVSAAKPKIADYPFTTLVPNLGVVRRPAGDGVVMADIPGLIEGASEGVGLGHAFLRHVERNRMLLHLVDISDPETQDPVTAYKTINTELARYSETLAAKPQRVVLTKIDAVMPESVAEYTKIFEDLSGQNVFAISAVARQGLDPMLHAVFALLDDIPYAPPTVDLKPDLNAMANDDSAFEIVRQGQAWTAVGGKLERLVGVTDFRNPSATRRLLNIFRAMGVFEALENAGVVPGDTVLIAGYEFEYHPDF